MYQLDYVSLIQEDADTLLAREKACHQSKPRQRLQMLRLLKSGQAENIPQVATMVGMSKGNATQLFKRYREHGLEALVETKYKGRRSRLRAEQEHILQCEGNTYCNAKVPRMFAPCVKQPYGLPSSSRFSTRLLA